MVRCGVNSWWPRGRLATMMRGAALLAIVAATCTVEAAQLNESLACSWSWRRLGCLPAAACVHKLKIRPFKFGDCVPKAVPCTSAVAPVCAGPDEPCFLDPECAAGGPGCNAGGVGQLCRFCGFQAEGALEPYPACPASKAACDADTGVFFSNEEFPGTPGAFANRRSSQEELEKRVAAWTTAFDPSIGSLTAEQHRQFFEDGYVRRVGIRIHATRRRSNTHTFTAMSPLAYPGDCA